MWRRQSRGRPPVCWSVVASQIMRVRDGRWSVKVSGQLTWLVLAGAVLLVVLVARLGIVRRPTGWNRLNVRYDLSWQSLDTLRATSGGGTCGGIDAYGGAPQGSRGAGLPLATLREGAPRHARMRRTSGRVGDGQPSRCPRPWIAG